MLSTLQLHAVTVMTQFTEPDPSPQDYQGLFFDYLVRQQFTWFGSAQQNFSPIPLESKLSERLQIAMMQSQQNPSRLLFVRLTLGEQLPGMVDLIFDQADTEDAMRKTINNESWLSKELLQWVNSPRYRKSQSNHDYVESLDDALDIFDGKMLAYQLVEFAMSQAASREGPFCKLLNRRVMEWAQELAQFCGLLAEQRGLCLATAKLSGLVQGLAPLAISQNFVNLFESQIKLASDKARSDGNKKIYDQLVAMKPPVRILLSHLTHSDALQHELLLALGQTGRLLAQITKETNADLPVEQLSEQARLLRQARGYSQYRWLNDACVLTPQQGHSLLNTLELSESELVELMRLRRR